MKISSAAVEGCGGSSAAVELAGEGAGSRWRGIEIEMEGESRSRWREIEIECPHEFKKCP